MTDFSLYMRDIAKKPSPSGDWLKGIKITFENMNEGTGPVERISAAEAMEIGGGKGPKEEYRGWHPISKSNGPAKKAAESAPLMGFGKHKERTMKWVRDNEPNYWEWCVENIPWFAGKVEKANL